MKINTEEITEIITLINSAEDFKPLITKGVEILKSYSKELKEPLEELGEWMREGRVKSIAYYKANGFTKKEAILLSLGDRFAYEEAMKSIRTKSK